MADATPSPAPAPSDVVWAFDRLLKQASADELHGPTRDFWNQVAQWLPRASAAVDANENGPEPAHLPPFPLKRAQLDLLRHEVHRAVRAREAGQRRLRPFRRTRAHVPLGGIFASPIGHLQASLRHIQASSWLIAVGLVGLALLNVADFVLLKDVPRAYTLSINLAAIAIVACIWAVHHFHFLNRVRGAVHAHLAVHHLDWHQLLDP